jgi:voltage-gated potassium channel
MNVNQELKEKLRVIIFEADTKAGKLFDIILLILIFLSMGLVILESVPFFGTKAISVFYGLEWILTILFTIEYFTRLYVVQKPLKYAGSYFGIIDLLSILPTYVSLVFPGSQYFLIIRALRLLRIFRILKLGQFLKESNTLIIALRASRRKITVFLFFILITVSIIGSLMFFIEGDINEDFSSIPMSMYWTIVTLTTVGYGDIIPVTGIGKLIASCLMILGYAVIAVPTGIVTSELAKRNNAASLNSTCCKQCSREGHDDDARFCKYCGHLIQ